MYLRVVTAVVLSSFLSNAYSQTQEETLKFLKSHNAGYYQSIIWNGSQPASVIPQAWMYWKNYYGEVRFNYEDTNTLSVFSGRPFSFLKEKLEVIPMLGFVVGKFTGLAPAFNATYENDELLAFTETEYCISFKPDKEPFFFNWVGVSGLVYKKNFYAGGSWQWIAQPSESTFDFGPLLTYKRGSFNVDFYAYNVWSRDRYWQLGVSYSFE